MGLLDGLLGSLLGGLNNNQQGGLLGSVAGLVGGQGGIQGLLQKFTGQGLGNVVQSWIGKGQNLEVSPDQVKQAFGAEQLQQLAAQAGIDPSQIAGHLAKVLPQVVDKATPDGEIVEGNALQSQLSSLLKGGLGGLFGK